jgi:hypothetical protein
MRGGMAEGAWGLDWLGSVMMWSTFFNPLDRTFSPSLPTFLRGVGVSTGL